MDQFRALLAAVVVAFLAHGSVARSAASDANGEQLPATEADAAAYPGLAVPDATPEAGASDLTASWSFTFASSYLFQGIDYSDGLPVLQPQLSIETRGLSALLWVNYDVETEVPNEYDLYLQRAWSVGRLSFSPGYAYLRYPHRAGWDPTHEALVDLSYDVPFEPSLSFHYDVAAGDGSYTTLGISHGLPGSLDILSLGSKLFYQSHYYATSGFPSWEVNTAATFEFPVVGIQLSTSYFMTWENGDFQGDAAVPSTWLVSMNFVSEF